MNCAACPLYGQTQLHGRGDDHPEVVIVGEGPGREEARRGQVFVGASAWLLGKVMEQSGLAQRRVYYTHTILCPAGEARVKGAAAGCCRERLVADLRARKPEVVVTLGNAATDTLLGAGAGITQRRGRAVWAEEIGAWVIPTYHPAAVMRNIHLFRDLGFDLSKAARWVRPEYRASYGAVQPQVTPIVVENADTLCAILAESPWTVLDLETSGLNPHTSQIINAVVATAQDTYLAHPPLCARPYFYEQLRKVPTRWVGHGSKFDRKMILAQTGVDFPFHFDTLLAHYALDERNAKLGGHHGLKTLAQTYLNAHDWESPVEKRLGAKGARRSYAELDRETLDIYTAYDGYYNHRLLRYLLKLLERNPAQMRLVERVLMPASNALAQVEVRGVRIDRDAVAVADVALRKQIGELQERLRHYGGEGFNPDSPVQLADTLFHKLGLPVQKQTAKGAASTDVEVLRRLRGLHPIVDALLEYRKVTKLHSTYVVGLDKLVGEDSRLHTDFLLFGTVTGRLCVSRDTCIEMPRNLVKYPLGVPITELKVGDYVYSYTWDKRLCLRKVKWVGITGYKPVLRITAIDTHTREEVSVKVTSEHLVRRFNGTWVPAGNLKIGDRLLCMVRRGVSEGYACFFPSAMRRKPGKESGGKARESRWVLAQLMGYAALPTKWIAHHIDGNTLNNSVDNLKLMYHTAHRKMHRPKITKEEVIEQVEGRAPATRCLKVLERSARAYGITLSKGWRERVIPGTNHTIISIEALPAEEVWDLEVEDTHAFIGNGVVLHNSSQNPNLQNLPAKEHSIRNFFVADEGKSLIYADLSQAEFRVAAVLSQDPFLVGAYRSGRDLHTAMGEALFGEAFTPEQRGIAKRNNFGLLYGMGVRKMAQDTLIPGMTLADAERIVADYFRRIPGVLAWRDGVVQEMLSAKYLETVTGRRRRFGYTPREEQARIGRQAVNFLPQSLASDITLLSLVQMVERGWEVLLTVHDSILIQAPTNEAESVAQEMVQMMEQSAYALLGDSVPFKAEYSIGQRWGELKG